MDTNNQGQGNNSASFSPTGNNERTFYVPDTNGTNFQQVGNLQTGEDRKPANRVKISQFTPGQKYCGVLLSRILDKAGKFGVSDLFFFKRVTGGTTANKNLSFSDEDDLIAVDSNLLKERLRAIEDGSLVILEYVGQHSTKRYKMWNVFVDTNFKPDQYGVRVAGKKVNPLPDSNAANTAQQEGNFVAQNQGFAQQTQQNTANAQSTQQYTANADDDLPF